MSAVPTTNVSGFLTIRKPTNRIRVPSVRWSAKKPTVGPNEVYVKVNIEIPDHYFVKPTIDVVVKLPSHQIPTLMAKVEDTLANTILQSTGVEIKIH